MLRCGLQRTNISLMWAGTFWVDDFSKLPLSVGSTKNRAQPKNFSSQPMTDSIIIVYLRIDPIKDLPTILMDLWYVINIPKSFRWSVILEFNTKLLGVIVYVQLEAEDVGCVKAGKKPKVQLKKKTCLKIAPQSRHCRDLWVVLWNMVRKCVVKRYDMIWLDSRFDTNILFNWIRDDAANGIVLVLSYHVATNHN